MRNCFIDFIVPNAAVEAGETVFMLNTFELDRETFKLLQEQQMMELTATRLDADYTKSLIFDPMQAAVELAASDLDASRIELQYVQDQHTVGEASLSDVKQAESRLAERGINVRKAKMEYEQRQLEIKAQSRKLDAQSEDLAERIELNRLIRELHAYAPNAASDLEFHTYEGAFVEEGDPICTVRARA